MRIVQGKTICREDLPKDRWRGRVVQKKVKEKNRRLDASKLYDVNLQINKWSYMH